MVKIDDNKKDELGNPDFTDNSESSPFAKFSVLADSKAKQNPELQRKKFIRYSILAVLVFIVFCVGWVVNSQRESAQEAFNDALKHSISKEYLIYETSGSDQGFDVSGSFHVDYRDVSNVKAKGSARIFHEASGLTIEFDSVVQDDYAYIYFNKFEMDDYEIAKDGVLNKWVRFDRDLPYQALGADFNAAFLAMGAATANGEIPDGNFSPEQREQLLELMINGDVYDAKPIEDETIEGIEYKRFDVKVDGQKSSELNRLVSDLTGYDLFANYPYEDERGTVWVSSDEHQLYKIITSDGFETKMYGYDQELGELDIPADFINPFDFAKGINLDQIYEAIDSLPQASEA